jgi:hypothetical protein
MYKHGNKNLGKNETELKSIKITSFNARGLKNKVKRQRVLNFLKSRHPGILFLQETYSTSGDEIIWKTEWKGEIIMSHGTNHSKGVAILIPEQVDYSITNTEVDPQGRYILIKGSFGGKHMSLLNYYAPTGNDKKEQLRYFDTLLPIISENHENLVLAGDLNVHLNPDVDKKGGKTLQPSNYAERILETMEEFNLIDVWRVCNPDKLRFTWRENSAHGIIQSRLDYFICPSSVLYQLKTCQIENSLYSDHNPITLDLYIENEQARGPGVWKFNTSLLTDSEYVNKIKSKLKEYEHRYKHHSDPCLIWDTAKAEIRGISISHASFINRQRKETLNTLNNELKELEEILAQRPDENVLQQISTAKKEIEEINNYITRGIIIRAKAKYIEQNEASSKLFLGLEKSKAKIKNISKLLINDSTTVTDPNEILQQEKIYYQTLYQEKIEYQDAGVNEAEKYFLEELERQVTDEDKESLDTDITDDDIAKALKELPTKKSPGTDGLPVDFYKFFWPDIKHLVCKSIKHAIHRGEMSIDQKRATLTLLPKKDKDVRYLKNWRPISLLNADYKILAKVLAMRIQKVIPYLINHDQSGCIKNRSTFTNIRSIYDVINYINENKRTGIITFIDYEKAFDTVNWKFLYKCLKAFNFGDKYIAAIKTLYNNIETSVSNNGYSSQFFKPSRGIRQGCPLSALLFIFVVETLANSIRKNPRIQGIKIGDTMWKISQYADDTTFFLNDEHSMSLTLLVIEMFSKCSGLKINRDKSEAMYIGVSSNFRHKVGNIKWTNNYIKCLGVYIHKDIDKATQYNIREKLDKILNIIKIWSCRHLTLKGKITIVNSLLISQMMYIASVIHIPQWAIVEYNKIIRDFIWNDKPSKIKYATLIAPYALGGMQLQDLQTKIDANKVTWIKNIRNKSIITPWKAYLQSKVQDPINEIPLYNSNSYDELKLDGKFYKEIFQIWAKLHFKEPTNAQEVVRQPLWNNSNINIDGKTVKYKDWNKAGINHIIHLIDNKGNLASLKYITNKYAIKPKLMDFNSLIHSIPATWKKFIKNGNNYLGYTAQQECSIIMDNKYCNIDEISTKDIYTYIIMKSKIKPAAGKIKWIEKYDEMDVEEEFWQYIYVTPSSLTKNSKILMIQYKIINRILAVNYNLKIWGKSTTDKCNACSQVDTIEHFMYQCPKTLCLWKSIQQWWKNIFHFTIKLSLLEIIFGIPNEIKDHTVTIYNYVLLHAKYYIYVTKKKQEELNLFDLILFLKKELSLKRTSSIEKSQLHKFNANWGELYESI